MNKLLLGLSLAATALTVAAGQATAADKPVGVRPAVAYDPCGPARFAGAYFGANVGGAAYTASRNDLDGFLIDNSGWNATDIAATLGVQAGFDWQACEKVFGVVADWSWSNAKATTLSEPGGVGAAGSIVSRMRWFSTFRARAGFAANDALYYVTGGLAVADIDTTISEPTNAGTFSFGKARLGVVGGAGAEFALGNNWSVNGEVLYMQFADQRVSFVDAGATPRSFDFNDSAWIARVGLNYRWGGDPAAPAHTQLPVKARPVAYPCGPARFRGGYVGASLGSNAYTANREDYDGFLTDNSGWTATDWASAIGVLAGYDWQSCNKVFGVIADWSWTNAKAATFDNPNGGGTGFIRSTMNWFATLRARAGVAVNDALIYVTGGVAAADVDTAIVDPPNTFSFSKTRWGLVGGVGTETALGNNWTFNSEILYMQFAEQTATGVAGTPFTFGLNDSAWVSRFALNYRWGGDPAASTAGLPVKAPAAAYPCGPARFNGWYAGANVGGVAYTAARDDWDGFLTDNSGYTATDIAATAGVQVGHDWQSCGRVFGVIADLNWSNARANLVDGPSTGGLNPVSSKMDWFGTLRTRTGLAINNTLVYVTGGLAAANIKTTIFDAPDTFNFGKTRWGLVGGAGAEYALGNNWTVNGEVLYMHFKEQTETATNGAGTFSFALNDSAWVGRVGLNYRFSSAAMGR